jgi:hypothetical protein
MFRFASNTSIEHPRFTLLVCMQERPCPSLRYAWNTRKLWQTPARPSAQMGPWDCTHWRCIMRMLLLQMLQCQKLPLSWMPAVVAEDPEHYTILTLVHTTPALLLAIYRDSVDMLSRRQQHLKKEGFKSGRHNHPLNESHIGIMAQILPRRTVFASAGNGCTCHKRYSWCEHLLQVWHRPLLLPTEHFASIYCQEKWLP